MGGKPTKSKDVMCIPRRMHRSPAYRKLTATSIFILMEFMSRRRVAKTGPKGDFIIINNGELIFTYAEALDKFKIYRSTFCRSISQLVALGFIDIHYSGGGMLKDSSKYGISDRWKNYGKEEFKNKTRQKDTRKLGFREDNWEKQTGRKRKRKSKTGITDDTRSSITDDTRGHPIPIIPSIIYATHKTDPNYYIQKGLAVLEAMHPIQYH
jgi:hypothetical protein